MNSNFGGSPKKDLTFLLLMSTIYENYTQIQLKRLVMRQLPMETIKNIPSLRVIIYAPQNIKLETHSQFHILFTNPEPQVFDSQYDTMNPGICILFMDNAFCPVWVTDINNLYQVAQWAYLC